MACVTGTCQEKHWLLVLESTEGAVCVCVEESDQSICLKHIISRKLHRLPHLQIVLDLKIGEQGSVPNFRKKKNKSLWIRTGKDFFIILTKYLFWFHIEMELPSRLHVIRARPYEGGSWECGPPSISKYLTLEK